MIAHALAAALTPDQMLTGINAALRGHDMEAVRYYLLALTIVDPHRAAEVKRVLRTGVAIRDNGTRV